jgi:hypothetical protein
VIRKMLLGLALAWAGYGALFELNRALAGYDLRDRRLAGAIDWHPGMPQLATLERFTAAARPLLPPGAPVVFASNEDGTDQPFFRYRWAAYLLPEVDLIPLSDPAAGTQGRYLLGYRRHFGHPRLVLLRRLPGGWLYRIQP